MDTNNDEEVISNTQEETVDLYTTEESYEESVEDIRAKLAKAEELAKNYKIRAEKAEKGRKEVGETSHTPNTNSLEDTYALIKANVSQEDISDVREYAQFKGISIAEALNTGAVRSILAEKSEQRTVASATNTGTSKRSSGKISDEALLANANAGKIPEDQASIDRLVALKMKQGAGRR